MFLKSVKLLQFIIMGSLALLLSACFHIQLNGSVGGGVLTISPLRNPDNILATAVSWTPEDLLAVWGQEKFDGHSAFTKLVFVGITTLQPEGLDPDALYLVSASGGEDYDPDVELGLTDNPVTVQGSWHTIASGQRILDGNLKVSTLTEALYRQMEARLADWSDEQIQARLDASAELVVGDVDGSGGVDYDDVLRWNRTLDGEFFLHELAALDDLSDAITAGQPASMITEKARSVVGDHTLVLTFDVGAVTVKTHNWESPITVANFMTYVRSGFYNDMLVHRAIDDFMIQMGLVEVLGTDEQGLIQWQIKTALAPIVNESNNGLSNTRGALSMARTSDPDSAAAQFFINQANNTSLDHGSSSNPDGYAVFARVISGMSVVDEIAAEGTVSVQGIGSNVPARGVVLESVILL